MTHTQILRRAASQPAICCCQFFFFFKKLIRIRINPLPPMKCKDGWRTSTRLIFRVSPRTPERAASDCFQCSVTTTECDSSWCSGLFLVFQSDASALCTHTCWKPCRFVTLGSTGRSTSPRAHCLLFSPTISGIYPRADGPTGRSGEG